VDKKHLFGNARLLSAQMPYKHPLHRSVLCLIFLTFGLLAKTSYGIGWWAVVFGFDLPITLSSQMSSVIFIDVVLFALSYIVLITA